MYITHNVYRNGSLIASNIELETFTDNGLSPNTQYTYQVSKVTAQGESALSNPLTVKTLPPSPTSIVTNKETVSIELNGTDTITARVEPSGASQEIAYSIVNAGIANVAINKNILTLTGLSVGATTLKIFSKSNAQIFKDIEITVFDPQQQPDESIDLGGVSE